MIRPLVITGGSRGIGAATAVRAARAGWSLCISYLSKTDEARAVVAECEQLGVTAMAVQADMAVEADIARLFATAESELGPLQGLVNNAGIAATKCRVEDMTHDRVANLMQINVVGAFLCAREAVRRMSTANGGGGGAIVNVSSRAAVLGSPGEYVDYAASKAAVDTLTVGLAREVATEGIRVNAVRPGLIKTDIHASMGRPERVEKMAPTVPMGRAGEADEVAAAIVWLLSDDASYVTGALLDVSGGR
ncbi:MAG: hypothetical protein QOG53_3580 [Frankiales bacterium]|jgi:NAD(P)-dependent dehydrogenase (short-subunit alcohol dehydrogenase family)|nr:hypothetical protein [Frankiales bacterium]